MVTHLPRWPRRQALAGGLVRALTSAASGAGQQPSDDRLLGHLSSAQAHPRLPGRDLVIELLAIPSV